MEKTVKKPEVVEQEHLDFLDDLRESGVTNMFGATPYLIEEFELDKKDARTILSYWMKTFTQD
ncbi:MAG: hypothetical protein J7L15_00910 [Clostridiales bacterium]|nr:hypothetical protein [Clostridiales bacterium]